MVLFPSLCYCRSMRPGISAEYQQLLASGDHEAVRHYFAQRGISESILIGLADQGRLSFHLLSPGLEITETDVPSTSLDYLEEALPRILYRLQKALHGRDGSAPRLLFTGLEEKERRILQEAVSQLPGMSAPLSADPAMAILLSQLADTPSPPPRRSMMLHPFRRTSMSSARTDANGTIRFRNLDLSELIIDSGGSLRSDFPRGSLGAIINNLMDEFCRSIGAEVTQTFPIKKLVHAYRRNDAPAVEFADGLARTLSVISLNILHIEKRGNLHIASPLTALGPAFAENITEQVSRLGQFDGTQAPDPSQRVSVILDYGRHLLRGSALAVYLSDARMNQESGI